MGVASVNGITLSYDDVGTGDDVLLLVHGHPFDRSMWTPQLTDLPAHGWRIVAPDLRGYGLSTVVAGVTTLDVFAADLSALLDALGIRSVVVCGLSMGGQIAMEFARIYPERVRGLVLAATFPQPETIEGKRQRNATADRLSREGIGRYADELLPKMLAPLSIATRPDVAAHVHSMMLGTSPTGAAAALRGRALRPSYVETLAALTAPSLVVVGDEDAFTSRADADRMYDLLRRSELLCLPGCGHMPNLERAVEFNAAVARLMHSVIEYEAPA